MTTKSAARDQLNIVGLLGDFRLLLILYFSFRVLIFLVYQPLILNNTEIGIAVGGDFRTYFFLGQLTGEGLLPFRDWWSEFPPIPAYLITGIYGMLGETPSYTSFASIFGILMLAADVGNLFLIRRIAARLHGDQTAMALCWIYALLVAPAIFMWWNFEPLVTFWLLLSLWWLLRKADVPSALAAGIGALTKFTPALLLGAVFRFRKPQHAARYTVIAAAVFALVYGALFIQNARMTVPSLTAQFGKASYQTVWALLDGNYRTGNFGPLQDRFDPAKASEIIGNPSVIPGWLRLTVAAAIGLWVFTRVRRFDERGLVAFVALTLLIFFLQAQGWSPQWQVQIIPLMLLALPTRSTVLSLVMLMALSFVEYPLLFSRTGDTGGAISGGLVLPYALIIILRTLLLISFCVELYRKLRQEPAPELAL
jgi:hypothetical protein